MSADNYINAVVSELLVAKALTQVGPPPLSSLSFQDGIRKPVIEISGAGLVYQIEELPLPGDLLFSFRSSLVAAAPSSDMAALQAGSCPAGHDADGAPLSLVLVIPLRFVLSRLRHLGDQATIAGYIIWALAFRQQGRPISRHSLAPWMCRLGSWQPVRLGPALLKLERAGLIRQEGDLVHPHFYQDEKRLADAWITSGKERGEAEYVWAPSTALPHLEGYLSRERGH